MPFLHFFDGFRTSHEVTKIIQLTDDELRALIDEDLIRAHRARALSPEHPVLRGSAQNPDVYFQMRESGQSVLRSHPGHRAGGDGQVRQGHRPPVQSVRLFRPSRSRTRRHHHGLGGETAEETVNYLVAKGEKVGAVRVRLYRPFSIEHFLKALPKSVKIHCCARSHQGTRRLRRAALSGYRQCAGRRRPQRHQSDRRTLWPVLQGIHARAWSRPCWTS